MRAYHFVGDKLRDGTPVPDNGVKLIFDKSPIPCVRGYHASLHPFDALQYAPGNVLCLVEVGGTIIHDDDKLVATERTIIKRFNAEELLFKFACDQALSVIHLWKAPAIVKEYLATRNLVLRDAARDAAWAATRADAARAAAWDAAWADAAWVAVRDAAWAAARAAADATRAATRADAARAAAWDAAWDAARKQQREIFNLAVDCEFDKVK